MRRRTIPGVLAPTAPERSGLAANRAWMADKGAAVRDEIVDPEEWRTFGCEGGLGGGIDATGL